MIPALRQATEADAGFLRTLYLETRGATFSALPPEEAALILDFQLHARKSHYQSAYPNAEWLVIEEAGVPIGELVIDRSECITIVDISIRPSFQSCGRGSAVLREVLGEAAGRQVRLSVDPASPAKRLYERLGFRAVETSQTRIDMIWG